MNSDNLILRQTDFPPLVNKNDFIDSSEFDANFTNIYEDLVALCVTSGVLNFDVDTEYDDEVNQFAMHDGRLYRFIFATPTSNVTPGTESSEAYWLEIFPTDLAHRKNSDTILAEGTASQVTASEIRAFIDAGLTSTTNLSITEHTSTTFKLNSSTGSDVVIPQATPTEAGLLNSEDKVKLQQLSGENSGDQTLGSLGAEAVANKVDNLDTPNATTYPTTNAVSTALSVAKSDIVGAAPSNLDTLEELANAIGNDPDFSDSVSTALGGKEASLPSMVGNALKVLRVNAGATAKEWYELPTGIVIGSTSITGGTVNRILFEGSGNVIQQDSQLTFDGSSFQIQFAGSTSGDVNFKLRNSAGTANIFETRGNTTFDFPTYLGGYIGGAGSEVRMGNAGTFYTQANQFHVTGSSVVTSTNGAFIQDSLGQNVLFNSRFVGTSQISLNMGRANIHLGGLTGDTHTGHNILGIANGTAPSASYTDRFMLYSADQASGNAAPHFRTENGDIQKIYSIGGWGTPSGTLTRTAFDESTVTLPELAQRVAALITDLKTGHQLLKA